MRRWLSILAILAASTALAGELDLPDRDPFWPVGYTPAPEPGAETDGPEGEKREMLDLSRLTPEQQAMIRSRLRVNGILKQGNQRIAIINSDVVREGDMLVLTVEGEKYRFRVRSLKEDNIVIEPVRDAGDT